MRTSDDNPLKTLSDALHTWCPIVWFYDWVMLKQIPYVNSYANSLISILWCVFRKHAYICFSYKTFIGKRWFMFYSEISLERMTFLIPCVWFILIRTTNQPNEWELLHKLVITTWTLILLPREIPSIVLLKRVVIGQNFLSQDLVDTFEP